MSSLAALADVESLQWKGIPLVGSDAPHVLARFHPLPPDQGFVLQVTDMATLWHCTARAEDLAMGDDATFGEPSCSALARIVAGGHPPDRNDPSGAEYFLSPLASREDLERHSRKARRRGGDAGGGRMLNAKGTLSMLRSAFSASEIERSTKKLPRWAFARDGRGRASLAVWVPLEIVEDTVCLSWEFVLEDCGRDAFVDSFSVPLVVSSRELERRLHQMFLICEAKDAEITMLRKGNATGKRTRPFDREEFLQSMDTSLIDVESVSSGTGQGNGGTVLDALSLPAAATAAESTLGSLLGRPLADDPDSATVAIRFEPGPAAARIEGRLQDALLARSNAARRQGPDAAAAPTAVAGESWSISLAPMVHDRNSARAPLPDRDASPRDASPRNASPRDASPRDASPRDASPHDALADTLQGQQDSCGRVGLLLSSSPPRPQAVATSSQLSAGGEADRSTQGCDRSPVVEDVDEETALMLRRRREIEARVAAEKRKLAANRKRKRVAKVLGL